MYSNSSLFRVYPDCNSKVIFSLTSPNTSIFIQQSQYITLIVYIVAILNVFLTNTTRLNTRKLIVITQFGTLDYKMMNHYNITIHLC